MRITVLLIVAMLCGTLIHSAPADDAPKPKVAIFPFEGSADADLRDKVGFSLRAKLDRQGTYEPIDGPTMKDMTS